MGVGWFGAPLGQTFVINFNGRTEEVTMMEWPTRDRGYRRITRRRLCTARENPVSAAAGGVPGSAFTGRTASSTRVTQHNVAGGRLWGQRPPRVPVPLLYLRCFNKLRLLPKDLPSQISSPLCAFNTIFVAFNRRSRRPFCGMRARVRFLSPKVSLP